MGSISTSVGLLSGIDTGALIESLLALDARQKLPIASRIGQLQTAKSALLDINTSLLALKNLSRGFRIDNVFETTLGSVSNEDVLALTTGRRAQPGTFNMTVGQLARSSQRLSSGFASADQNPLGLEELSFEFGRGRARGDIELSELNGGAGVRRGSIIVTDRSGASATVDLTRAATVDDVLEAINNAEGVNVRAEIRGEGFVLSDLSGGAGDLSVRDSGSGTTASDLGLAQTVAASEIVGGNVNSLGFDTALSRLNDGRGVMIRDFVADFRLQVGADTFDVDLGRVDAPLTSETSLDDLNNGLGVAINEDVGVADFVVVASDGTRVEIDLGRIEDEEGEEIASEVTTVGQLLDRVNQTLADELGSSDVTLSIGASGTNFVLTDTRGGGSEPRLEGSGPNGTQTYRDLGLIASASGGVINGNFVPNRVDTPRATTIGDLAQRVFDATGGAVSVEIAPDGQSLRFNAGGETVSVLSGEGGLAGDPANLGDLTLEALGFTAGQSGTAVDGGRVLSSFRSILVDSLNGGRGLEGTDTLTFTDRQGDTLTINGLSAFDTLDELLESVNTQLAASTVDVTLSLDDEGLRLVGADSSGGAGEFTIAGDAARVLGLGGAADGATFRGDNLQRAYVTRATSTSDLNQGRGLGNGSFEIVDSAGSRATIDIDSSTRSVQDLLDAINESGLALRAEINANGDGIALVDTNTGTQVQAMSVTDLDGAVASALGIEGTAASVGGGLVGSEAITIDLNASDTLNDVVNAINEAGVPLAATLLNTGGGARPYFLSLTSEISGRRGDLVIDTGAIDISFDTLVEAQDAQVFVGSANPAEAILVTSSTNTLEDIVTGVSVDLLAESDEPVSVQVSRDEEGIFQSVRDWVESFNEIIDKINRYDSYDQESERRGPLLGDSTVANVRTSLYRVLQGGANDVDGEFQFLSQVGIRIGTGGRVEFDEAQFTDAWERNAQDVEKLFVTFEAESGSTEEIAPGITVDRTGTNFTALGFGDLFDQLLDSLTNPADGTVKSAERRIDQQVESGEERMRLIDSRIEARRLRLQSQYAAMEATLASLQTQQSSLFSLSSNLALAG